VLLALGRGGGSGDDGGGGPNIFSSNPSVATVSGSGQVTNEAGWVDFID